MIKSALVAMVVIGCDSDASQCEFIRETPPQWASVAECEDAMRHQMLRAGNFDYPTIVGLCRAAEDPDATVLAVPAAEPEIQAKPVYAGMVEGGRSILYRTANGYTMVRRTIGRAALGTAEIARRTGGRLLAKFTPQF